MRKLPVHFCKQLIDRISCVALVSWLSSACHRIDFIDEYDRWGVLSSKLEHLSHSFRA